MLRRTHLSFLIPLLGLFAFSCASTGKASEDPEQSDRYIQRFTGDADKNTGLILTELDGALSQWAKLTAVGDKRKDGQRVHALRQGLNYQANKHYDMLASELEAGPVRNRQIAAMALGFSSQEGTLSALLNALNDLDERVEINALLGLSVLEDPLTPMSELTSRMSDHTNPQARAMAASAVLTCLQAGADGGQVLEHARRGLNDEEPVVRVKSTLILAEMRNADSIPAISDLLYDEVPLVVRAARYSIAHIGMTDDHARGDAARALTSSLERVGEAREEVKLMAHLKLLSSIDHGDKIEDWVTWAKGLP